MKFKCIKPNSEANLTVKSEVYYRINRLMMKYMELIGPQGTEQIGKDLEAANTDQSVLEKIDESNPTYHYMTLYYLLSRIEQSFTDAGLTEEVDKTPDEINEQLKNYNLEVRE